MAWLLDTNAWIDYLRDPQSRIRERLMSSRPGDIRTCAIVRAELLHGARKYGVAERRASIVREALAPFVSLPFDDACAEHYARVRHELEVNGERIGPFDLQIAAICLAHDCTLVTGNAREFSRVPGLRWENWQQPA